MAIKKKSQIAGRKPVPRRIIRRSGFTLLEVMIALAFVAIALVAVIEAQGQGIVMADEARFKTRALFIARALLSDAETDTDLTDGVVDGQLDSPFQDLSWRRETTPMPFLAGLFRVQVQVHRTDRPPTDGVMLEALVYRGGQ